MPNAPNQPAGSGALSTATRRTRITRSRHFGEGRTAPMTDRDWLDAAVRAIAAIVKKIGPSVSGARCPRSGAGVSSVILAGFHFTQPRSICKPFDCSDDVVAIEDFQWLMKG